MARPLSAATSTPTGPRGCSSSSLAWCPGQPTCGGPFYRSPPISEGLLLPAAILGPALGTSGCSGPWNPPQRLAALTLPPFELKALGQHHCLYFNVPGPETPTGPWVPLSNLTYAAHSRRFQGAVCVCGGVELEDKIVKIAPLSSKEQPAHEHSLNLCHVRRGRYSPGFTYG